MQTDSVTRVILALILVCTLLLVGEATGMLSGSGAASIGSGEAGRFQLLLAQQRKGGPLLIRIDSATGTVWRKGLTTDGPWVIVDEETRSGAAAALPESVPDEPPAAPAPSAIQSSPGGTAPTAAGPSSSQPSDSPAPGRELSRRRTRELYAALAKEAETRGIDVEATKPAQDLSVLVGLARSAGENSLQDMAIGQIGDFEARSSVPALLALLDHPRPRAVVIVIQQLEAAGDPVAAAHLTKLAGSHPDPHVRRAAIGAATRLSAPPPPG